MLERRGKGNGVRLGEASVDVVVPRHPVQKRHCLTDSFAHRCDHLERKPHAVEEATAVVVVTQIGVGRNESV